MTSTRIDLGRDDPVLRLFPAPMLPGEWSLPDHAARHWLVALWGKTLGPSNFFLDHEVPELRWRPLPFYPGYMLAEAAVRDARGRLGAANAVIGPEGCLLVDGNSAPWHDLNSRLGLRIEDAETAAAYLAFFCNAIHGDEGRFRIVTQLDASCFSSRAADIEPAVALLRPHARPIHLERSEDGFTGEALVFYSGNPFVSRFTVRADGLVEMEDDEPIELEDPGILARERYTDTLRWPL